MNGPPGMSAWEMHAAALIAAGTVVAIVHGCGLVGVLILLVLANLGCADGGG